MSIIYWDRNIVPEFSHFHLPFYNNVLGNQAIIKKNKFTFKFTKFTFKFTKFTFILFLFFFKLKIK
jgi:hypothetical protein